MSLVVYLSGQAFFSNLLHSEKPKLYAILAILSAIGLIAVLHLKEDKFVHVRVIALGLNSFSSHNKYIIINTITTV